MAVPFFQKFPLISYDVDGSGAQLAIDILQRIKIRNYLKNNFLVFYTHDIRDGDTPEIIAAKVYGSTSFHWIILLANDIVDPVYDWPMSYENLILTIQKKYTTPTQDGLQYSYQQIHHYEDNFGHVIDQTNYLQLPDAERKKVTIYDWEISQNESKRRIRILDNKYVSQIDAQADSIMKQVLL